MRLNITNCLTAVVIGIIAISAPAFAQDAAKTGPKAGQHGAKRHGGAEKILAKLDLTPDQKEKIKAIHEAAKAKIQPIHDSKTLTDIEKKAQIKAITKDTMKKALALLTPEQKAKLKELRQERDEKKDEKQEKSEKKDDKGEKEDKDGE